MTQSSTRNGLAPAGRAALMSTLSLAIAALAHGQVPTSMRPPDVVAGATVTGHLPPATVLYMTMSLQPSSRAALEAYANAVSSPASEKYHRFLSPAQIGERFGASQSTVNAAASFLKSKGFTVTLVADNRMAILFKGRADRAEKAFSTRLNVYSNPGRTSPGPTSFFSFTTPPKLPANLASKVVTISGLSNAYRPVPATTLLTPNQDRTLYNAAALYGTTGRKGQGVNIGITNFDGYRLSNLPTFYSTFGLPTPSGGVGSNVKKVSVNGFNGEAATPGVEGDLDIQMVLGNAPLCNLFIYDGNDILATITAIANDDKVDIATESYGVGGPDDFINALHDQHTAMTVQGITYMAASGDTGTSEVFAYPHQDPEILAVGGSDATVDASGNRITEFGWDGSGSGWDTTGWLFNTLPIWQVGTTVPTNINHRLYPDIALHATGSQIIFNGGAFAVGGTSSSSPQFAGLLGLIIQELTVQNSIDLAPNGRPRLGRLNDFIYSLNGDPAAFTDITTGNTGTLPDGSPGVGKVGWDFVTGWGAPNVAGLVSKLINVAGVPMDDLATAATIYSTTKPNYTYGTNVQGDTSSLSSADGATYSLQTVRQAGVGQVGAVAIDFNLNGSSDQRINAVLTATVNSPKLTTGFIYLQNVATGSYDVVRTITGTGANTALTIPIDLDKYVDGSTVHVLVRAMKPVRLGSSSFRLTIDEARITERIRGN